MLLRFVFVVTSLTVALPFASASAQSTVPQAAKWAFSLGADPSLFDLNTPAPGVDARVVANLTRSWQSRNSKWARHISLMVGAEAPRSFQPAYSSLFGPQCNCSVRYASRYAALTAGVSYDLFRVSRFTPYLAGGTGIYYTGFRRSAADGVTPAEFTYYKNPFSQDDLALGAKAGLGLKIRLGTHELFIEQMLHQLNLNRRGMVITPLNIGIRF